MAAKITIEELSIAGFRAYLENQAFKLAGGRSLAVYAPNAKGKSSLVDAIDFYLSDEGTLERLGLRRSGTQAGPEALEHVRARAKKIQPKVSMKFRDRNHTFGDARALAGQSVSLITPGGQRVRETRKINFIIRGYELRRFVEERTSQQRYADVSQWFSLSPLLDIQNQLRNLRIRLSRAADDHTAMSERLSDLRTITGNAVMQWDNDAVLSWINKEQVHKLDGALTLDNLDKEEETYKELKRRAGHEAQQIGLSAVTTAIGGVRELYTKEENQDSQAPEAEGAIAALNAAQMALHVAVAKEAAERSAAEKAVFKDIWAAAEKLLEEKPELEECPVCVTPLQEMPPERRENIVPKIKEGLAGLKAYREASDALAAAQRGAANALATTRSKIDACVKLLEAAGYDSEQNVIAAADAYKAALATAHMTEALPDSSALEVELTETLKSLLLEKKRIEDGQGDSTYTVVVDRLDRLISLKDRIGGIERNKEELRKLHDALVTTEGFIAGKLRLPAECSGRAPGPHG